MNTEDVIEAHTIDKVGHRREISAGVEESYQTGAGVNHGAESGPRTRFE